MSAEEEVHCQGTCPVCNRIIYSREVELFCEHSDLWGDDLCPGSGTPAKLKPATFLDLVRQIGAISRDRCHPDCDLCTHRREVASCLGILLENPELLRSLAEKVRNR